MPPKPVGFGAPMNPADLLQQVQNNPQAMDILSHFGLGIPSQLRQNFVLPEPGTPGFFGQHPQFTRGIENALLGVASMGPPGMTAGENISNVARGVLAVPQMRREHAMMQIMAPFQTAQMLGEMEKNAATSEEMRARGQYFRERGDYYARGGANKAFTHYITQQGQPVLGVHADGTTEQVMGPDNKPIIATAHQSAAADPAKLLFWRAMGLDPSLPTDPNERKAAMSGAGAMLGEWNRQVGIRSGLSTAGRLGAEARQPGFLNPAQKEAVTATNTTVNGQIRGWERELENMNDVTKAANWALTNGAKNDTEAASLLANHKKELQDNIAFHTQALQDYPTALSQIPGLTYNGYVALRKNNPSQQTLSGNVSITPATSGANPEDEADRFMQEINQH